MPFSQPPPVALHASECGGVGVDFIARLPLDVTRRVLMHLPARQLARVALVNQAWLTASADDALWAGAYDVSYGSLAAEHLAAISMGDQPPKPRRGSETATSSFTESELHPEGGWRTQYLERYDRARNINRRLEERETHIRKYASGKGNEMAASMAGLELSGASYFSGR